MVHSHRHCGEEGETAPLQPKEAEEICLVTQNHDKLLQMHNRERPVRLYHSLVGQLHRPQLQGSLEGGAVCTMYHRGRSQEGQKDHQGQQPTEPLPVHTVTIQKAKSVQVHQS
jgi:hypothetical protein